MAGKIRGAFGAVQGMSGGSGTNGFRTGSPQSTTSGPPDGRIDRDGLAQPERGPSAGSGQPVRVHVIACPATAAATRTAAGVIAGLLLTLIGAVSYAVLLTRETRALAQANRVRIDSDHQAIMAIQRQLIESADRGQH